MAKSKETSSSSDAAPATALVPVATGFALFSPDNDIQTVLKENMGGELRPSDLDRIGLPSGGGQAWAVPTIDGEDMVKEIEGVIIYWNDQRVYFKGRTPTKGTQPDCVSNDMVTGRGDPGGNCDSCPLNQWGTAVGQDGAPRKGKACKERSWLYVMRENDLLPILINLSPGSLKAWRQYRTRLTCNNIPYFSVLTRIGLEPLQSFDGIKYSAATFKFGGKLDAQQIERVKQLASMAKTSHKTAPPAPDAAEVLAEDIIESHGAPRPA